MTQLYYLEFLKARNLDAAYLGPHFGVSQALRHGYSLIRRLNWGRICFQAFLTRLLAGSSSPSAVGLRALGLHWLLVGGHSQGLAVWASARWQLIPSPWK